MQNLNSTGGTPLQALGLRCTWTLASRRISGLSLRIRGRVDGRRDVIS